MSEADASEIQKTRRRAVRDATGKDVVDRSHPNEDKREEGEKRARRKAKGRKKP
jgi:hypothetical protein